MADPGEKAAYHAELEVQVKERRDQEAFDKQNNREVGQILSSKPIFDLSSDSSRAWED